MVHDSVVSCVGQTPLVSLQRIFPYFGIEVIAKLELLNPGGSVKDRPARFIVERGLKSGEIEPGSHLIESTSGNLGIALAMVTHVYDLSFTSVVDPKISPTNLRILQQFGANIDMVHEPDDQGGYLKTRIRRVKELLQIIPKSVWINQYANQLNWQAHYYGTGDEIVAQLNGPVDYLVIAVSTTGTIMGLARRLRKEFPKLKVVAVDAEGSVIFGTPPRPRELPGIGSSRVPELLDLSEIDEVITVNDKESAQGCHELLLREGIFAGGSSGSVIAALGKMLPALPRPSRLLTLFPDRGERYLDMVYDNTWMSKIRRTLPIHTVKLPTSLRQVGIAAGR